MPSLQTTTIPGIYRLKQYLAALESQTDAEFFSLEVFRAVVLHQNIKDKITTYINENITKLSNGSLA